MKFIRLDIAAELKLAAEWYAHPSARAWKEIIHPQILASIITQFRAATSDDARAQLQGALNVISEINEVLRGSANALKSISAREETKQTLHQ